MVYGTVTAYRQINPATGKHFGASVGPIDVIGRSATSRLTAFVINVIVAAVLTAVLRALKAPAGEDITLTEDYRADQGDPRVRDITEIIV